jgi:hypothetical protein
MGLRYVRFLLFLACCSWGAVSPAEQAEEIVRRSVANTTADWSAAPQYDFTERDVVTAHRNRTMKTYFVMMIDGSPYNKLVAVGGHEIAGAAAANEDRKLEREIDRRRKESPTARQKRVAEYQKERRQDHALMAEMAKAFVFKLVTQVLTGMRGRMWVDAEQYQWVKVHAEVFRPVSFGLFFARVKPGTNFTLEQRPVGGSLWLPSHFSMAVNARVFLSARRSSDDEVYSNYHQSTNEQVGEAVNEWTNKPGASAEQ